MSAVSTMFSRELADITVSGRVRRMSRSNGPGARAARPASRSCKRTSSSKIRVNRNGKVIHEGGLQSLKRFKDDVREVAEGYECGVKIAGHDDIKTGDVIEVFEIREVARKLEKK